MKAEMVVGAVALVVGGVALAFVILTGTGGPKTDEHLAALEEKLARLEHDFRTYKGARQAETAAIEERLEQLEQDLADLREKLSKMEKSAKKPAPKGEKTLKPGELEPSTPALAGPSAGPVNPVPVRPLGPGEKNPGGSIVGRLFERFSRYQAERLRRFAEERGWDNEKTERVAAILKEQRDQMQDLLNSPEPNADRRAIIEQMRQIMSQTMDKLKEVMTEEELREFRRSMLPGRRRLRPPFGRRRPEGGQR